MNKKTKIIFIITIILIILSTIGISIWYKVKDNNNNNEQSEEEIIKIRQEVQEQVSQQAEQIANSGEWIEATGSSVGGKNYAKMSSNGVPIPNSFTYQIIEDEVVIKDYANRLYIWVPCTLEELTNTENSSDASEVVHQELEDSLKMYNGFYVGIEKLAETNNNGQEFPQKYGYSKMYLACANLYFPTDPIVCNLGYEKQYNIVKEKLNKPSSLVNLLQESSDGFSKGDEITQALHKTKGYVKRNVLKDIVSYEEQGGNTMGSARPFLYIRPYSNTEVNYEGATQLHLLDTQLLNQDPNQKWTKNIVVTKENGYTNEKRTYKGKNFLIGGKGSDSLESMAIMEEDDWEQFVGNNVTGFVLQPFSDNCRLDMKNYDVNYIKQFVITSAQRIVKMNRNAKLWIGIPMYCNEIQDEAVRSNYVNKIKNYLNDIKATLGSEDLNKPNIWDYNVVGIYYTTERIYGKWEDPNNLESNLEAKLMNDVSYYVRNGFDKDLTWTPYIFPRKWNASTNQVDSNEDELRKIAFATDYHDWFDCVILQPHYAADAYVRDGMAKNTRRQADLTYWNFDIIKNCVESQKINKMNTDGTVSDWGFGSTSGKAKIGFEFEFIAYKQVYENYEKNLLDKFKEGKYPVGVYWQGNLTSVRDGNGYNAPTVAKGQDNGDLIMGSLDRALKYIFAGQVMPFGQGQGIGDKGIYDIEGYTRYEVDKGRIQVVKSK